MCFMLFAGTDNPLPLKEWTKGSPDICVKRLSEDESAVETHFTKAVVQYVGSTSGCGCDFPHWVLHNGEIPADGFDGRDEDEKKSNRENARALVKMLRESGEDAIELYGVWAGNYSKAPIAAKDILLTEIDKPTFLLGEQVFYRVLVKGKPS